MLKPISIDATDGERAPPQKGTIAMRTAKSQSAKRIPSAARSLHELRQAGTGGVLAVQDITRLQRTIGNRAVARLLSRSTEGPAKQTAAPRAGSTSHKDKTPVSSASAIQRLILVTQGGLDMGGFIQVLSLLRRYKDEKVLFYHLADLKHISEGENIHLVDHGYGSTGKFGNKEALILASELIQHGLPPHVGAIKLLSCNSGKGGDQSYAAILAIQLAEIRQKATKVVAYSGDVVTSSTGHSNAQSPESTKGDTPIYDFITKKWDNEIKQGEQIAAKGLEDALKQPEKLKEIIIKTAEDIEKVTQNLFQDLYKYNETYILKEGKYKFNITPSPKFMLPEYKPSHNFIPSEWGPGKKNY